MTTGMPTPDRKRAPPRWLKSLPLVYLLVGLVWILGSDLVVGWLYRDDIRALMYTSALKGAVFVTLTATLLYVVLAMRRTDSAAEPRALEPIGLRRPLIAFVLVGIALASIGYVVCMLEAAGIRARAGKQQEASAQLAASEVALWYEGCVRAMRLVADGPFMARGIAEWQASRSDAVESLLRKRFEGFRANYDFAGAAIVATDGMPLLAAGRPVPMTVATRREVANATSTQQVISRWVTVDGGDGGRQPVLELLVALRDRTAGEERVVAVLIARADIRWPPGAVAPDAEATGATVVLARVEGDHVGFIEPGVAGGAPRYSTVSRAQADLAVVRGVLGEPSPFAARDQAERGVLAAGSAVEATPWFAIATVERAAIEEQIRRLLLLVAGMSTLGFVATGALMLPWWWRVRAGADALVRQAESRADEMATRLGWVTRHANDVILLLATDGRILDANDRAEQAYGYSREELLALAVFDLRPVAAADKAAARAQFETVQAGGSLVFEATHVRKDGTAFPVEVSSRQVVLGDQRYVQSIVRDISDRRRAEEKLRDSEMQYRLLFRDNPHPMWVYDVETLRFLAVNDAAVEHYGYSQAEFLGMTIAEIRPPEDRARLDADVRAHADDVLQRSSLWRHRRKDGTLIDVEITSHKTDFGGRRARLVLADDVTDRLRAERALRTSEARYRSLFENASDGVLVLGESRRVLAANAECQALFGYSLAELMGLDPASLLDEQEHARLETEAAGVQGGLLPAPATWILRRKDGSRFAGEVRVRGLPDGSLLATVRDLTEIIAARRRIERQRDLYDLLSQCNQAIVRVGDRQQLLQSVARLAVERGRFLFAWVGEIDASGRIAPTALYGDDAGYVAGLSLTTDPATADGVGPTGRAIRAGKAVIANDFLADPSTSRWHDAARTRGIGASAAFPIRTGGKVTAALMLYARDAGYFDAEIVATLDEMVADVSYALDALQTRRALDDNRLLLQSLIDASDALVYAFDLDGRAILINDAGARATGGTVASRIGRRRDEFLPPAIAAAHELNDRRVIESGAPIVVEEHSADSGVERVFLSVKYPLKDVDGRVYAVGGISTDMTELRRIQQQVVEANLRLEEKVADRTREAREAVARAEAADQAKTLFLGSMSHELRSPLHSIIGFTSVLLEGLEGELTAAQQEHLRVISDASHHLLAIINDLLDMSRIEAGSIAVETKPLPIKRPLERVMQRFRLQAQEKGLQLRLETPDTDTSIEGDERRIEQVVSNLVSNAIKYTAAGSVVVGCRRDADRLRIEVRDTGPGIAVEDQKRVFARFAQLKPEQGSLTEGAGLGLAIAAGLAEAMGGEIALQSEPGAGSVFSLLLPLPPQ
jgi:PAS domain S-box-containing protein